MPQLLALDIATTTGFAFFDTDNPPSSIRSGTMRAEGKTVAEKAASLALSLDFLLRTTKPDMVALSEPLPLARFITKTEATLAGPMETAMLPPALLHGPVMSGAVIAVLTTFNIPFITIAAATYRKHVLGFARKSGFAKADWQKALADKLREQRIPLKNIAAAPALAMALAASRDQRIRMLTEAVAP
ncbi:hypothetical protein [Bartonella sp. LJL80]